MSHPNDEEFQNDRMVAVATAGRVPWVETALAVDAAMVGAYGLVIYNHQALTESRLAAAEAELQALKEPRREDEATPA